MSQGTEKTQGTVRRNLCHRGSFQSRMCVIFPTSLFAFSASASDGVTTCCRHDLLFCGPVLFPTWQSIAHVALQNYSIHSFTSPQSSRSGLVKSKAQVFLKMDFHALSSSFLTDLIHEPFPGTAPILPRPNTTGAFCDHGIISAYPAVFIVENQEKKCHLFKRFCRYYKNIRKISHSRRGSGRAARTAPSAAPISLQ